MRYVDNETVVATYDELQKVAPSIKPFQGESHFTLDYLILLRDLEYERQERKKLQREIDVLKARINALLELAESETDHDDANDSER